MNQTFLQNSSYMYVFVCCALEEDHYSLSDIRTVLTNVPAESWEIFSN